MIGEIGEEIGSTKCSYTWSERNHVDRKHFRKISSSNETILTCISKGIIFGQKHC